MPARRWGLAAAAALLLAAAAIPDAAAQCALCGASAGQAAEARDGNGPLAAGILILLLPSLAVLAGAGFLLWKYRGDGGDEGAAEPPMAARHRLP